MRAVVQRVSQANVIVHGAPTGSIQKGFLVLVGVGHDDTPETSKELAYRIAYLRVFSDEAGKMQYSVQDVGGEILLVSQFTLYGDVSDGHRPSFTDAANAGHAKQIYSGLIEELKAFVPVQTGVFGAHMEIHMTADGPVTILVEI